MATLNRLFRFLRSRGAVMRKTASPGAHRLIIACALALIAVLNPGAAGARPTHTATEQRASTSATATPVPTATPATTQAPSMPKSGLERAVVRSVVDGDTLDVAINGRTRRIRLIGVDTPETTHPSRPVECFGREASRFLTELVNGQTVLLESDPSQGDRDRYNRLLRFVWLPDGRLVNYEIIAQGYGFEYTFSVPYVYQAQFKAAQRAAREAQTGLWAPEACNGERMPAATPSPAVAPTVPGNQALPSSYNRCRTDPNAARAPNAPVAIVGVNKRTETVTLRNVSNQPISLDGWTLCSFKGSQIHRGVSGTLAPGETRDFTHTGGASIWNNRETDPGGLYDPQGRLVSYWPDR
jgi:micrococcal nuclease